MYPEIDMTTDKNVNGSAHTNLERVNILVVGSGLDDVVGINQELRQADFAYLLHVVGDAAEAMAYLLKEQPYAGAPKPDLILLYTNIPTHSRIEFFSELANHPGLVDINVVRFPDPGLADDIVVNGATVADDHDLESRAHSWLMREIAATGRIS